MASTLSVDDRLARYGHGIRDQLASFPMARARDLVDELAALRDELVRRDVATTAELIPPGPEGGVRPIGALIELRSGEPALVRQYRAWRTNLRWLLSRRIGS